MRGDKVRILARNSHKARQLFGKDVEVSAGDLGDANSIERACRGVEVIYHIGGIYRFGFRHRRELWRINVEGTDHLLRCAATAGTSKVIHLSSGGLLHKNTGELTYSGHLDENDYPVKAPDFSSYKYSKWHAEQRALAWAKRGLPVVIASTTCPIGGGDEAPTPTGQMIHDFLRQRFPFYCRTALNFHRRPGLEPGLARSGPQRPKGPALSSLPRKPLAQGISRASRPRDRTPRASLVPSQLGDPSRGLRWRSGRFSQSPQHGRARLRGNRLPGRAGPVLLQRPHAGRTGLEAATLDPGKHRPSSRLVPSRIGNRNA